ncbi:MAG: hypothetical protein QOI04_767 [Verrucomicrobiota bacterium]|jgi:hypothetical protein
MCAAVFGFFLIGTTLQAMDEAIVPKVISKEEAAKKYPAPKGGYPVAMPHGQGGSPFIFDSPYSKTKTFDCRDIPRGSLVLDKYANKVFIRP